MACIPILFNRARTRVFHICALVRKYNGRGKLGKCWPSTPYRISKCGASTLAVTLDNVQVFNEPYLLYELIEFVCMYVSTHYSRTPRPIELKFSPCTRIFSRKVSNVNRGATSIWGRVRAQKRAKNGWNWSRRMCANFISHERLVQSTRNFHRLFCILLWRARTLNGSPSTIWGRVILQIRGKTVEIRSMEIQVTAACRT